jgi:hypothetical protein
MILTVQLGKSCAWVTPAIATAMAPAKAIPPITRIPCSRPSLATVWPAEK